MGLGYGWQRAIEAATRQSFVFVPGDNTWPYPSLRDLFASLGQGRRRHLVSDQSRDPGLGPRLRFDDLHGRA